MSHAPCIERDLDAGTIWYKQDKIMQARIFLNPRQSFIESIFEEVKLLPGGLQD